MTNNRGHIIELIKANSKDPGKVALQLYSGESLTYGDLFLLEDKARSALEQLHIRPYERIALITNNSLIFLPLMLAVLETATFVPLEPEMGSEHYGEKYKLLSIDYLLTDHMAGPDIEAAMAHGMGILYFQTDAANQPGPLNFKVLQELKAPSRPNYKNEQTAILCTTSGTTSQPKIVPRLYSNYVACIQQDADFCDYNPNSVNAIVVPFYRTPSIRAVLTSLISNGSIIYTDGIHPKRIADALKKYPITNMQIPPAGLFAVYEYLEKNSIEFSPQHRLNISLYGAPLPFHLKKDIEKRLNAELIDFYGMNEASVMASSYKAPKGYKYGSVGCPNVYSEIKIMDNEILVKGMGVFAGYENNPEVTRDSFIDGWFRTGDIGYFDEDGYLFIQGRIRELINRGGEKVSPFEVEEAILSLGNIKNVTVFPYPNKQGSDSVGAIIVPGSDSPLGLREIRSALKEKIRPFKLPTLLYTVNEIPTSANTKVQRNYLYKHLQQMDLVPETLKSQANNLADTLTPTQSTIQELWQSILEQDFVALDDNFFDLGGDSLSAAELLAAIETSFGCILPVNQFFKRSTIREIAELVDKTPKFNAYQHLVPIRPEGTKPPLFFVHALAGEVITYQYISEHIDQHRPVYGFNFNFRREGWNAYTPLNDLAQAYVQEMERFYPDGPYYIGGFSMGGTIAFEMARILNQHGNRVVLIMFDTISSSNSNCDPTNFSVVQDVFRDVFKKIRKTPAAEVPKLVLSKTALFYETLMFKLQLHNSDSANDVNLRLNRGLADNHSDIHINWFLLKYIHSQYRPGYYPGIVYYLRALKSKANSSHEDWKSLSQDFVLIEKDFDHMDYVAAETAEDTAGEINLILEEYEQSL